MNQITDLFKLTTIGSEVSVHSGRRVQTYGSQSDVFDSPKPCCVMLTFETRIIAWNNLPRWQRTACTAWPSGQDSFCFFFAEPPASAKSFQKTKRSESLGTALVCHVDTSGDCGGCRDHNASACRLHTMFVIVFVFQKMMEISQEKCIDNVVDVLDVQVCGGSWRTSLRCLKSRLFRGPRHSRVSAPHMLTSCRDHPCSSWHRYRA